jgi:cytochrome d ubiquinol oxidase subunit I
MEAAGVHRLQFAFTITYHYLFPQLTMGLALLLVVMKTAALVTREARFDRATRFWARIFAINFAMGVVTGIPMEFQFGTNWAQFSRAAGGVVGQTLAMESVFAFFLESSLLGLFLLGEERLGRTGHWLVGVLVFAGAWLSGYFIVATSGWMQHPVAYVTGPGGEIHLASLRGLLLNEWALWEYAHTMIGAVQTGCFAVAAIGAFYLLNQMHEPDARLFVRTGVLVGVVAALVQLYPTGDEQGRLVATHQPVTLAAMEGLFHTEHGAPVAILGQPDVLRRRLDNPLLVPRALSFLTYRRWTAPVTGLDQFPESEWPDPLPVLYYAYHVMVGLGTIFIAEMALAAWLLWRGRLYTSRPMLWLLMISLPLPYIANTAGWITAELGRQPWIIHGLMRTAAATSPAVAAGNVWFTLIGFAGTYALLSVLFLFLVAREIARGPHEAGA